jgi:hypothetical protein
MHNVRINPTTHLLPNNIVENVHNQTVLVFLQDMADCTLHFLHLCMIITACAPTGKRITCEELLIPHMCASPQSPWVVADFSTPQKSHMAMPFYYCWNFNYSFYNLRK